MALQKRKNSFSEVIRNKSNMKVSTFGIKVLKKLGANSYIVPLGCGGGRLGSLIVPKNLISELVSWDLLAKNKEGRFCLSVVGSSFLIRNIEKAKSKANKQAVGEMVSEPYLSQHQIHELVSRRVDGSLKKLNINLAESPLGWLRKRKNKDGEYLISIEQFEAAERFRCDYEMSTNSSSLTANYDGVPISKSVRSASSGLMFGEKQLDAKRRYDMAVKAMGSGLSDSVIRVCCYLEGFQTTEKFLGWPSRSVKLVMTMALDRLVEHYKKGERPAK
jgi:hypothetical protein